MELQRGSESIGEPSTDDGKRANDREKQPTDYQQAEGGGDAEHLDRSREAAEATGMGLNWTQWRFTVEVGSKIYLELVKRNEIPAERVTEILQEMNLPAPAPVVVKKEPIDVDRPTSKMEDLLSMAKTRSGSQAASSPVRGHP